MAPQGLDDLALRHIPQLDGAIIRARGQATPIKAPCHALGITRQGLDSLSLRHVPQDGLNQGA